MRPALSPQHPSWAIALLLLLSVCGGEPTTPPTPGSLTVASGDAQSGTVGANLSAPLVVAVKDTKGAALSGAAVTWSVASGGGSVSAASTPTGADGTASVTWMLGGTVGQQSVTAGAGTFTVTFTATAAAGPVAQVVVTPATGTLKSLTETLQLTAATRDAFGNATQGAITWSSSNTSVLTLNAAGLATAVANGTAEAVATSGSITGKATLTVAQAVATVTVSPSVPTVQVGAKVQLTAALKDAKGFAVQGGKASWASRDTSVAAVDTAGQVTGKKEGQTRIVAASGAASDSVTVTVTPDVFKPTKDTEITGTVSVSEVNIPKGVKVTVKGDLALRAGGSITVGGTLEGDCVGITLLGRGPLTISGTVTNRCSDAGAKTRPSLVVVGGRQVVIDSAVVESSGDIVVKNDSTLTEEDFAPSSQAARARGAGLSRADADGYCRVADTDFNARAGGIGSKGEDGTPNGGDGGDGNDVVILCEGNLILTSNSLNRYIAHSGGDGGAGSHSDKVAAKAKGGHGGAGGLVRIGVTGSIEVVGEILLQPGGGGNGGAATATGLADDSRSKGASAEATGGDGGSSGYTQITVFSEIRGTGTLELISMTAGKGGVAAATGARGRNAGTDPAGEGGDATATGGRGGDVPKYVIKAGGFISVPISVIPPGGGFLAGAYGGEARVTGGDGGSGNELHPDGARGGKMVAQGGTGGGLLLRGTDGTLLANGHLGGKATYQGALGGYGWSDCGSTLKKGGAGAAGGSAAGGDGPGGTGKAQGGPGGVFIVAHTGNGGGGGNGEPAGKGGVGGSDGITVLGSRVQPEDAFQPGKDGKPCKSGTYSVSIGVASDPSNHNPYLGGGGMTTVTQIGVQLDPAGGTITFTGQYPWTTLTGTRNETTGTFSASGKETYANGYYKDIQVVFTGTLTCQNQLTGALQLSGFPAGTANTSYTVTGSRPGGVAPGSGAPPKAGATSSQPEASTCLAPLSRR